MITVLDKINIEKEGVISETSFRIDKENIAQILDILRNATYSNKPLAVVREYCSNALDAHKALGITRPIQVALPSRFTQEFRVRDFGPGLSESEMFEIFTSYGASTKRDSNAYIGMLGIGSKSGFCISSTFSIVSYNNVVKTTYCAYIDESGVGKLSILNSEPTNESGIEIIVPVPLDTVNQFNEEAFTLFSFFETYPEIVNSDEINQKVIDLIHSNDECAVLKSVTTGPYIVMGSIYYKVNNTLELKEYIKNHIDKKSSFFRVVENDRLLQSLVIKLNIGDVNVSASREYIILTEKAKQVISEKIFNFLEFLEKLIKDEFASKKSLYEANKTLLEFGNNNLMYYYLAYNRIEFNGQSLLKILNIKHTTFTIKYNHGKYRLNKTSGQHIDIALLNKIEDNRCLLLLEEDNIKYLSNRIRETLASNDYLKILVIHDTKQHCFDLGIPQEVFGGENDLLPQVKSNSTRKPYSKDKIFVLNSNGILVAAENADLNEFALYAWYYKKESDICNLYYLRRIEGVFGVKLYFVKNNYFEKHKEDFKNWEYFKDYIKKQSKNLPEELQFFLTCQKNSVSLSDFKNNLKDITNNSLFVNFVEMYKKGNYISQSPKFNIILGLNYYNSEKSKQFDELIKLYPMISNFNISRYVELEDFYRKHVSTP